MADIVLPSQRCFGPFGVIGAATRWQVPSHVMICTNPKHGRHFVDTRTGVILTCPGPYVHGGVAGPSHMVLCKDHGHVVDKRTGEVIG
jgi:hypothetical protein